MASLSLTMALGGYPVIFRTGEYQEGELAVYVPVDSIVPDRPEWSFLGAEPKHRRIGAKRLRNVFSMGMLCKAPEGVVEGQEIGEQLGITRWDDSEDAEIARGRAAGTDADPDRPKGHVPSYDLDGLRAWKHLLTPGEEVVITEKIHGESARFFHDGTRLWVGSRTTWKRLDSSAPWAIYARREELEVLLQQWPNLVLYGELYGNNELKYDAPTMRGLRIFDIYDMGYVSTTAPASLGTPRGFLDYGDMQAYVVNSQSVAGWGNTGPSVASPPHRGRRLESVPELYRGPWSENLLNLGEGASMLAQHVREGFVVRPVKERLDPQLPTGRVVLKFVGEGFLTRKKK